MFRIPCTWLTNVVWKYPFERIFYLLKLICPNNYFHMHCILYWLFYFFKLHIIFSICYFDLIKLCLILIRSSRLMWMECNIVILWCMWGGWGWIAANRNTALLPPANQRPGLWISLSSREMTPSCEQLPTNKTDWI